MESVYKLTVIDTTKRYLYEGIFNSMDSLKASANDIAIEVEIKNISKPSKAILMMVEKLSFNRDGKLAMVDKENDFTYIETNKFHRGDLILTIYHLKEI